ncbi:tape measure protein [Sunxiuqinia indica]|uniref:tape measure protein n=1 Tax=Sunxiuqinia indica TaxID=2692584 RepID=UPI00135702D1|nr:tape measure protein [Sunxiuqinia indica]
MAGQLRREDILDAGIKQELTEIAKAVQPVIDGFKRVADEGERLSKSVGGAESLSQIISLSKKATTNSRNLSQAEKERLRVETQLQKTIARSNALRTESGKKLIEEKVRLQEATRAAREKARANQGIVTSNRGLLGSFNNLIKSLKSYLLIYLSIAKAGELISSIIKTTATLDSLDFAMKRVITDQIELAQTQQFLADITEAYGIELVSTTERYIKFRAAAMQSNLSAKDTQKIFESAAKAGSVLGLRTDELRGVFLALEQMLSKGKVTTEELRRQLGERLPGAFGIMAKALNVTIPQLDKMLKKGEVLSAEVLPKFAEELERSFGIESVDRVDTLVAAQNRLTLAWQGFIDELNASKPLISIYNSFADSIQRINSLMKSDADTIGERSAKIVSDIRDEMVKTEDVEKRREILVKKIGDLQKERLDVNEKINKLQEQEPGFLTKFAEQLNQAIGLGGSFTKSIDLQYVRKDYEKDSDAIVKAINTITTEFENLVNTKTKTPDIDTSDPKEEIKKLKEQQKLLLEETKQQQQLLLQNTQLTADQRRQAEFDNDQELLQMRIGFIDEQLKYADKGTSEELKLIAQKAQLVTQVEENLTDRLLDEQKIRQKELEKIEKDKNNVNEQEADNALANAEAANHEYYIKRLAQAKDEISAAKGKATEIKRIDDQLTDDLIANEIKQLDIAIESMDSETNAYERAVERRRRLREQQGENENQKLAENEKIKQDLRQQTYEKSKELLMEGFNFASALYDRQLQNVETRYNYEVAAAGDSLEKKVIAERKYEKEKNEIMKRQAIAEKAQAALSIALNTAAAIVEALPNIPLSIIIGVLGAAQLATVLATPIPEFAEGTDSAPKEFIAGDEGSEAIFKPDGTVEITPNKPTYYNDKSYIGSTIIPHDETQKWLADYAVNHTYDNVIDMSGTNKYLKKIEDNTRRKKEVFERNGQTYIRRGYITSKVV